MLASPRRASARRAAGTRSWQPPAFLALLLVIATGVLVTQARHLWFFGDEWAFLAARSLDSTMFEPHNGHWSTLPLIVYRVGYHVLGPDHYLAWSMMPIALHVLICVVVYRLARQQGLAAWPAALATGALALLSGNVAEDPLWAFQIGFMGSLFFGLVALLAFGVTARPRGIPSWIRPWMREVTVWVVTVLSMTCSGMALPMLGWLVVFAVMTRGVRSAAIAAVPPLVVYAVWYVAYGRDDPTDFPRPSAETALAFVYRGVSLTWNNVLAIPDLGAITFLALSAVALFTRQVARYRPLAVSGLVATVGMYTFIAPVRAGLGVEAADAGRYAYLAVAMGVPALAGLLVVVGDLLPNGWERAAAGLALTTVVGVTGISQTIAFRHAREGLTPGFQARTLGTVALLRAGDPVFPVVLDPIYSPNLSVDSLRVPDLLDRFPHGPVSVQGRLDAAVTVQSAVTTEPPEVPVAPAPKTRGITGTTTPVNGCATALADDKAYVELPASELGSTIGLRAWGSSMAVRMRGPRELSYTRELVTTPGATTFVESLSSQFPLRVPVPAGVVTFCAPEAGGG